MTTHDEQPRTVNEAPARNRLGECKNQQMMGTTLARLAAQLNG